MVQSLCFITIMKTSFSPIRKWMGFSSYFLIAVPMKNLLPNKSGVMNVPYFAIPISYGLNSTQSVSWNLRVNATKIRNTPNTYALHAQCVFVPYNYNACTDDKKLLQFHLKEICKPHCSYLHCFVCFETSWVVLQYYIAVSLFVDSKTGFPPACRWVV